VAQNGEINRCKYWLLVRGMTSSCVRRDLVATSGRKRSEGNLVALGDVS